MFVNIKLLGKSQILYGSRRKLLGKVKFEKDDGSRHYDSMRVWTVKGTDEYIYALSVYDGTFYKRAD